MAKQIITLETNFSKGGVVRISAAFWLPVPSGQEVPIPSLAASQWKNASAEDLAALQVGSVLEEVEQFNFPVTYGTDDRRKFLQTYYEARAAALAEAPAKGKFYGEFFDSAAGWSGKG